MDFDYNVEYSQTWSGGVQYELWPAAITRVKTVPLAGWVAATAAPGNTAPEASLTRPATSPVFVWATAVVTAGEAVHSTAAAASINSVRPALTVYCAATHGTKQVHRCRARAPGHLS